MAQAYGSRPPGFRSGLPRLLTLTPSPPARIPVRERCTYSVPHVEETSEQNRTVQRQGGTAD